MIKLEIIFKNIFNLTFVDCLNHFRGSKIVEELEGMNNLEEFLKDLKKDIALYLNIL